jgi:hypothetical protein
MRNPRFSLYDEALLVPSEEIELLLRGQQEVPWCEYLLNPRRLRGSDFLMRWSQGVWSEKRLVLAVNETSEFCAMPYGPSGVAPQDPRGVELYFERLEKAGLGELKRPDMLVFPKTDKERIQQIVREIGGEAELPFVSEDSPAMREIVRTSVLAVECENSLWISKRMPDYGAQLKPQKWLNGQLGLRKAAVAPTVIMKEEDRGRLREWQAIRERKIHIWHVFYDAAFGISLDDAESLIMKGLIRATEQTFQAPSGPTTRKSIFKIYYQHAYPLAVASEEPTLVADHITDSNGHILPYVRFEGGAVTLTQEAIDVLRTLAARGSR